MDVKEAARRAKEYVADLFAEEGIGNIGLEEIEPGGDGHFRMVTVGFSRPWHQGGLATVTLGQRGLRRSYKVLRIDNGNGNVESVKDRLLREAERGEPLEGYYLDANLLVLLIVGSENRDLIAKHRRLEHYSSEDYDIPVDLLGNTHQLFVTPNTLTEASNLVGQHGEPERTLLMRKLHHLIEVSEEITIASDVASSNPGFERLGYTDAALLEVASTDTPLPTVDFDLYLAAMESGEERAVKFTHYRNL